MRKRKPRIPRFKVFLASLGSSPSEVDHKETGDSDSGDSMAQSDTVGDTLVNMPMPMRG